jgi:CBS domain-containing protein
MRAHLDRLAVGIGLALLSPATFAGDLEEAQTFIGNVELYVPILMIVVAAFVYFTPSRDKRAVPLRSVLNGTETTPWVGADVLVVECARKMADEKIGALVIMDGKKLIGIFTERDAVSRVMAAGRDPGNTKVCEVMTLNPCCVSPGMTVGAAMDFATEKRFRHLPIVENGNVRAVLSIRDLTQWLVKDLGGMVPAPV